MNSLTKYLVLNVLPVLLMAYLTMGASKLHDPTRPPNLPATTDEKNTSQAGDDLLAIFVKSGHSYAIINDQTYEVGDKFGEFTITTITPYTVELTGADNSKQVLELVEKIKTEAVQ